PGFGPDFSWIDPPVFEENGNEPAHYRGVVASQPGLYFVGLHFLYAMSSGFLPGVDRDAEHVVHAIVAGGGGGRPRCRARRWGGGGGGGGPPAARPGGPTTTSAARCAQGEPADSCS